MCLCEDGSSLCEDESSLCVRLRMGVVCGCECEWEKSVCLINNGISLYV